jgi:hypothetical protein
MKSIVKFNTLIDSTQEKVVHHYYVKFHNNRKTQVNKNTITNKNREDVRSSK